MILHPAVLQEPPPQLVLGDWERHGVTEGCWGDHRACLVGLDPMKRTQETEMEVSK